MTDFKVGDRVRIAYEGAVTHASSPLEVNGKIVHRDATVERILPPEPTGLGAVVVTDKGETFIRTANPQFPWVKARQPGENAYSWSEYGGLDGGVAVEVPSEGIQS